MRIATSLGVIMLVADLFAADPRPVVKKVQTNARCFLGGIRRTSRSKRNALASRNVCLEVVADARCAVFVDQPEQFNRLLDDFVHKVTLVSALAKASSSGYDPNRHRFPLSSNVESLGKTRDVEGLTASQPMLDALLVAAKRQHRVVHRDNFLRAGGFYRGDHFEFFSAGVPVLFLGRGKDFNGQPAHFRAPKGKQIFPAETSIRPSDEVDPD